MPDVQHQNDDAFILDIGNQAIVADTVAPFAATIGGKPLAMLARVLAALQILADPSQKKRGRMAVHFLQYLLGRRCEKHMIRHASPSSFSTSSKVKVSGFSRYSFMAFS